jgi:hypothetical protein
MLRVQRLCIRAARVGDDHAGILALSAGALDRQENALGMHVVVVNRVPVRNRMLFRRPHAEVHEAQSHQKTFE